MLIAFMVSSICNGIENSDIISLLDGNDAGIKANIVA
jgi:hypothetical protein